MRSFAQRRGFSLVELMITLAVACILSAIALPGYSEFTRRVLRQEARLALLGIQHRQELHFIEHHQYAMSLAPPPAGLALPAHSEAGNYLLHIEGNGNGTGYLAVAVAAGRQSRDQRCVRMALDETGRRLVGNAGGGWREADPDRCWG
jgi:type IV pilus assembly protein PilE